MSSKPEVVDRSDVDIANRGADSFLKLFYSAYDSSQRNEVVPTFYRASSTVNWNGTAVEGSVEWAKFLLKMPQSRHDVQSYDCHAVPGSAAPGRPPSLLITVSGIVTFGEPSSAPAKTLDTAPRVFSQTFLLLPDVLPESTGDAAAGPKYFVGADSLRFVG